MKINRDLELAMSIVLLLRSKNGAIMKTSDMASALGNESVSFLEQINRKLARGGILKAIRGPGGGYTLQNKDNTVNASELASALGRSMEAPEGDSPKARLSRALADSFAAVKV